MQYILPHRKHILPWLAICGTVLAGVLLLHAQGRLWICRCGYVLLWSGNIISADNSQHLFDPYSFTHVLHGVVFGGLLAWIVPRVAWHWRLWLALLLETAWEVVENSAAVIERYRVATLAVGYYGDTVLNSVSDIAMCALGVLLARRLGLWRSVALFVITELVLLVWIRDSLLLNVLMLLFPLDAIRQWQMGR